MIKKILLILLLCVSLCFPATIEITSWAEVQAVNSNRAGDYKLMNDLDKDSTGYATYNSGDGWTPLGSGGAPLGFRGSFDGNGKTIADLRCQRGVQNYAGLFGYINNSGKSIINLNLKAVDIYNATNNDYVGAFAGYIENATVSGITTSGEVSKPIIEETKSVGGFAGSIKNSTVSDCASHCDVSGYQFVSGFSGAETSTLSRCISTGAVNGTQGLYGFGDKGGGTWTDVFWDTQTSGVSAGAGQGGTGKTTAEMKDITTYANFDIALMSSHTTETWFIDDGNDYPRLWYEKTSRARVMMGEDELMCLY